jgi:putative FmdB family regulatory protein
VPLYDYDCANCGHRFEVIHGVTTDGPTSCPSCGGGPVRKAISAPAVHFKGSGWAKKERRTTTASSGSSESTDAKPADGATEKPKTDTPSSPEATPAKPAATASGSAD